MILALVKLEGTLLRRERRLMAMLLVIASSILLSCLSASLETARGNSAKRIIAAEERARWVGQGEKDPHSAAHYSIYAFKPAAALAPLDSGIEPFVGQAVWLEAHAQNDMLHRPKGQASPLERAGISSPATLLATLAPLIAFVLGFAAMARERERGVWRLALGTALRPASMLLSKALVIWLAMVVLLLVPAVALTSAFSLWQYGPDADIAVRTLAWSAMMALYFAIFVLGGLAVAVLCRDSRAALAILFGVWVLLVVALPRTLSNAAEAAVPLPTTQTIRSQLQQQAPAYWSAEVSKARREALLAQYGVARAEDLPINERGAQLDMAERHSHEVFDRVLGSFYDRVAAQDSMFSRLSALSPTAALHAASQHLTGTDFSHHRGFIEQAETYRRDLVNRMNHEVQSHVVRTGERHLAGRSLWEAIEPFTFEPLRFRPMTSQAGSSLASLLAWSALAVITCVWTSRRLRP